MSASITYAAKAAGSALFLSFHLRNADGGAGGLVARNFATVVSRSVEGTIVDLFQDDAPGRREIAGLTVDVIRRKTATMVWRLVARKQVGRLRFRFQRPAAAEHSRAVDLFIDGVGFASVLGDVPPGCFRRTVMLHHNFEPDYYADIYHGRPGAGWWTRVGGAAQRTAMREASLNLFLTRQDMAKAEQAFGPARGAAAVFGVFEPVTFRPDVAPARHGPLRVLVTGTLSDRKGYLGLVEMLRAAVVRKSDLSARICFVVAGRNPTPELSTLADGNFITIIPNPPAMAEIARSCDIYLNPNFTGSGIKIRNFDGLRHGLPVLCRRENAAGFDHLSAPVFTSFDSVADGIDRLQCLSIPHLRSASTRSLVWESYVQSFGLDSGIERLRALLAVN